LKYDGNYNSSSGHNRLQARSSKAGILPSATYFFRRRFTKSQRGIKCDCPPKTQIEYLFRKPLADAAAALESLRELRNTFTDPLERIDQYVRSEILRHSNELAAAADKVRLELEKKAAEEQADPWEVERIVPGRATLYPHLPRRQELESSQPKRSSKTLRNWY